MTEQPIDPANGRPLCTKEFPMPKNPEIKRWAHEDVKEVGDSDYTATYECLNCGIIWTTELPQ